MLQRFLRSVVTFASVIVAYQVYVLMAVPLLEPQIAVRQSAASTAAERTQAGKSVGKHQRFLSAYFPADHWTQLRPPIVLERGPGMLVRGRPVIRFSRYDLKPVSRPSTKGDEADRAWRMGR